MAYEILMPQLGLTMEEGTVSQWIKHEGDAVKAGDVVAEITTDKLTHELQSEHDGVLLKNRGPGGGGCSCKGVLAYIGEAGGEHHSCTGRCACGSGISSCCSIPRGSCSYCGRQAHSHLASGPEDPRLSWVLRTLPLSWAAAPLAASPRRISWQPLEAMRTAPAPAPLSVAAASASEPAAPQGRSGADGGDTVVKLSGMRKVVAERMLHSTLKFHR